MASTHTTTATSIASILVPSSALGANLLDDIDKILKSKEGTCSVAYGCLLRATFVRIVAAYAKTTNRSFVPKCEAFPPQTSMEASISTNKFVVEYTYEAFLPQVDVEYKAIVVQVFSEGTIVHINGCKAVTAIILNIQIPVGSVISIKLKEIKFHKNAFQCVALLADGQI